MMDSVPLTAPEVASLSVGSLVIASYPQDQDGGWRYRAKVEEIEERGEERIFRVRYIDYGNASQVGPCDLFQWNPVLEVIPAQAFACRLRECKMMFKHPVVMRTPEAARFLLLMKVWSPFQMVVSKVRRPRERIFSSRKCKEPEIVVDLVARDGILVSKKLSTSPLKHLLRKVDISSLNSTTSPSINITSDSNLISSSYGPPSETLRPFEKVRLWMQFDQGEKENKMKVEVLKKESSVKLLENAREEDIDNLIGLEEDIVEFSYSDEQKRILESLKEGSFLQARKVKPKKQDKQTVSRTRAKAHRILKMKNPVKDEKKPTNTCTSKNKNNIDQVRNRSLKPNTVCLFFLEGRCRYGQKCWFRHEKPITENVKSLATPVVTPPAEGTTVVVWVSEIQTPSKFYIMFPYGTKCISELSENQRKKHPRKVPEKRKLIDDMNKHHKDESKYHLDSIPRRGSLVAVKERKYWVRARVTKVCDRIGNVRVFLVDDGRTLGVNYVNLRKLDSKFKILPFQVRDACIEGLVPVRSSWSRGGKEARRMREMFKDSDYLSANIVTTTGETLVTKLRVHKGGETVDVGQVLCHSQLAVKREVIRRGNSK